MILVTLELRSIPLKIGLLLIFFVLGNLYCYSIFLEENKGFSSIRPLTSALSLCSVVRYCKFAFKRAGVDTWLFILGYLLIL